MSSPINEATATPFITPNVSHPNGHAPHLAPPALRPQAQLMRLADVLADVRTAADAAHEARVSGRAPGPVSGLAVLDRELSGAFMPGVHFVHGQPGTGKTAFALQIAAMCGCPALFVTCEMAPVELLRRLTARATSTFLGRLKSGEMTGADVEALTRRAIESAPGLAFLDATRAPAPAQLLHDSALIVRGVPASGSAGASNGAPPSHLLIVVDSLHSWAEGLGTALPEYEALNAAVAALRTLAARLACPVLVVCERNRADMKSGGMSAGAGTRKIEYSAETVLDLKRAEGREDGAGEIAVTLSLEKNRHGAAGRTVALKFHGALQRFAEAK